jgi:hypothetical protein
MAAYRHGEVVLTKGEFAIKAGVWSFFITHKCGKAVYTMNRERAPVAQGPCEQCNVSYPKEMEGFIELLDYGNDDPDR